MSIAQRLFAASLASLFSFALMSTAQSHEPSNPAAVGNLKTLIQASKLILHGKVSTVQYVNGSQSGGGLIPHGFVTYSITEVLFPKAAEGRTSITLKFVGGPDGQGRFLDVVGVPKLMVGDEDILFLKTNGVGSCPIVMCEFGRYRVLENLVYEAHGSPIANISTSRITTSGIGPAKLQEFSFPAPKFDELMKNPSAQNRLKQLGLSVEEAQKQYEAQGPTTMFISEGSVPPPGTPKLGLSIDTVKSTLRTAISQLLPPTPPSILDANPSVAFTVLPIKELAPK